MSDWINMTFRIVKIRHPRKCYCCQDQFQKGEEMFYNSGITDGGWYYNWWCRICDAFYKKSPRDFDDGIYPGEFKGEQVYEQFKRNYKNEQLRTSNQETNSSKLVQV